ncbi:MAG: DMT family transporter [Pseudomonadota bacterium]
MTPSGKPAAVQGTGLARLWPVFLLLVLGLSWGGHFSLFKIAAESSLSYLGIIALTTSGVVIGMTVVAALRRRWPRFTGRHLRFYLVCAALGYLIEFPLSLFVAEEIPAGLLAIIASTSPVFTSLIAIVAKVETVSRRRMAAVAVGLVAAAVVLVPGTAIPQPSMLTWVLIAFLIPVVYATYHNYVAYDWPDGSDSWQVAFGEVLIATAIVLPIYLVGDRSVVVLGAWSPGTWTVFVMAALALIEIYLYFEIVRLAGAVFVSLTSFVSIVAGVLWGMILFGEQHNAWIWLAVVLLGLSIFLAREKNAEG